MFWFWLFTTITQIAIQFFPIRNWKWYYLEAKCSIKGCGCRSINMYQVVDNPAAWRHIKNEVITIDFVNTMWNLVEHRSMTTNARCVRDINHYFAGRRGPI